MLPGRPAPIVWPIVKGTVAATTGYNSNVDPVYQVVVAVAAIGKISLPIHSNPVQCNSM